MRWFVAIAAGLILAGGAQAHVASKAGSKTARLQARIAHDRGVVAAVDRQARTNGSAMFIEWRMWKTRQWHARDLSRARASLYALSRPAHYAGWVCIHRREGAWNDPNAPYYGGLQMSWNWMNVIPGGDAGKLPGIQQMRIAEAVAAKHGFSYSWMKGQWPLTFPPCAGYF